MVTKVDVLKRTLEGSKNTPRTSRHILTKIENLCAMLLHKPKQNW